jgi:hypothetical protein
MKELRIKIMIIILTLFTIFDPSIKKIKSGKKYLHSLFSESFNDDALSDSINKIRKVNLVANAFRYK